MPDSPSSLQIFLATRAARIIVPIAAAVLLIVGLAGPALLGVVALATLVAGIAWWSSTQPASAGTARLRAFVLGILVALLVARLLTWLL
ncbi:hypothetical protein CLV56_3564 [Mumia flava]|uniref:Uncharacterized protein n=1 Tax=Mumia flava TaxID=1348852 RepID=A0A0B2BUQ9_9ACTN|nr:hypothetical protein [Mumia flava]PJJ54060.1 hypothetical protein CLV56_3564 [Mumia flava]